MLTPDVHELPLRRDTHVRDDFMPARAATTIDADGTLIVTAGTQRHIDANEMRATPYPKQ